MNEHYDLKKYGADKIVFLGMFLLATLTAQLLVSVNSNLKFSKPIELEHTGLSISIPSGKGWETDKQWRFEDNSYVLSSQYSSYQDIKDIEINCRYFMTTDEMTPEILLDPFVKGLQAEIVESNQVQKENITINWARIERPYRIIMAVAELTNNRKVIIEITEIIFDLDIAKRVLEEICESLSFEENNLVKAGTEFVSEIKSEGIDSLIDNYNKESSFFILDKDNQNAGFTIYLLKNLIGEQEFNVRGASYIFSTDPYPHEQKTIFRCDKSLNKFSWDYQTTARNNKVRGIITLDETGIITVNNIINDNNSNSETYLNCSNVIPGILLIPLISPAIEKNIQNAIIDIIDSRGEISPTLFSLKSAEKTEENYSYILTLKSFFSNDEPETFYLNNKNEIIKADGDYYLDKTDMDAIKKEFPQLTDSISTMSQTLNTDQI